MARIVAFALVVLTCFITHNLVFAGGGGPCEITASCCSASAGHCELGQICTCSYTCGGGISSCSCRCGPGEIGKSSDEGSLAPLPLDVPDCGWTVGKNPARVTLGQIAGRLEEVLGWRVNVDTAVASVVVPAGMWRGTWRHILLGFAAAAGVNVAFDEATTTVTFAR